MSGAEEESRTVGDAMIDKIVDEVYVSGASAVLSQKGREHMNKIGITHVLTVSAMPIPNEARESSITYEFCFAMDSPVQDLLGTGVLSTGVAFIEEALKDGGKVLVHCEVGMSRSTTVVAAYLMKRFSWTVDKAILHIQIRRPIAFPNEGFVAQLSIYRNLGYKTDPGSLAGSGPYRTWCMETGNTPESGVDPRAALFVRKLEETTGEEDGRGKEERGSKYRCRKCREPLFYGKHVLRHERTGRGTTPGERCEFGFLIEPLTWMDTGEYQGKVCCPKCGEKLGGYSWGGRVCQGETGRPCSTQVQPWVHIHKTKVDEVRAQSVAFAPQLISSPPLLPSSPPPSSTLVPPSALSS